MAAIGNNYAKRQEKPSLADFNKAWSNTRKKAIQQGQQLRANLTSVFATSVTISQQQTVNAIQGSYSSTASAMARVNILV
ncbi:hypothetical protein [Roseibium litorale]|uniref:Uncharacterized protein n=1 Tax=Roseibium litorale TaxID=2803841 RepID=A0ABR9CKT8_9HYPH|nr:hypothetical protein [Roseibium litorale]MBD8891343.1 hypothetical protein [Roseibium litorale]